MRNRPREGADTQILAAPERKNLRKGMSRKMKIFLATGAALAGTALVGGVVAKQRFAALTPEQQLDFANSAIGRTRWSPWLSGRIRSMRDAGVMRALEDPNAGAGLSNTQRLALANRVVAATADSPQVSAAVAAKRDAAVREGLNKGLNDFSGRARRFFSGGANILGGGGTQQPAPTPAPAPMPVPMPKRTLTPPPEEIPM